MINYKERNVSVQIDAYFDFRRVPFLSMFLHFQPCRVDSTWKDAMLTSQKLYKPSTTDIFKDDLPGTPKDMVPTYGKLPILLPISLGILMISFTDFFGENLLDPKLI